MRDPQRIPRILDLLERYWEANPDLRFFQMLWTFYKEKDLVNSFYLEDDLFENRLRELVRTENNKRKNDRKK